MSLTAVRDQDMPIRLLRKMLDRGRVPNGLLFWGADGVGKRMAAFEFAKALNCDTNSDDACDTCLSCRKAMSGNHPDIKVVAPMKKSRIIDVETIEGINEFAALRSYEGRWRVFIILDADRMRPPAQNHFLKTLEEPPGNSVFILVTSFPRTLLPTIRSRCQSIRFGTLNPATVAELLQRERDLPPTEADAIARIAQGQMSRALNLVDSEKRNVVLDVAQRLADGEEPSDLADEFTASLVAERKLLESTVKSFGDDIDPKELTREEREQMKEEQMALLDALAKRDLMEYLYLFETWYRDALVLASASTVEQLLNADQREQLAKCTVNAPEQKLEAIEAARVYLERNIDKERVFRNLFFALAK